MRKLKFNTDKIIGLSAMLISLLTLIIFIYQTNLVREQSRLSVTPRLAFNSSIDTPDSLSYFTFYISNKGLGPGIIESIEIIHKDERYKFDFPIFLKKAYPKYSDYGWITQQISLEKGITLSEKESIKFLTMVFPQRNIPSFFEYLKLEEKEKVPFDMEVVYSSIYGEKWKVNSNQIGHPTKL